jgi:hypothetical protein
MEIKEGLIALGIVLRVMVSIVALMKLAGKANHSETISENTDEVVKTAAGQTKLSIKHQ